MSDRPLRVLVIAVGGNVSQGILKALAKSSLACTVIGSDISELQFGLFSVDRALVGPWAHEDGFLDWLLLTCEREKIDVILSGAEPVLGVLSQHKDLIEARTKAVCLVSDRRIMNIGDDKFETCRWLEAQGLNFPQYAASDDADALSALKERCGFPLIAKPRHGGGSVGVAKIENDRDLEYFSTKQDYLIQEYLGDGAWEYTAGCFCDKNGEVRGSIVMKRELLAGTTYRAVIGDFPEVRKEAERVAVALKPQGPCNIQLRVAERGPVCFEINPRFSGTTPIRAHFGFNEVDAALRHFVLGEDTIDLPFLTRGVALRYWNEIYPDPDAVHALRASGRLDRSSDFDTSIEPYGTHE